MTTPTVSPSTEVRRASLLAAVRLYAAGARPDVAAAAFTAAGVDVTDLEQLRAVAHLAQCERSGVEPSPAALTLLLGREAAA